MNPFGVDVKSIVGKTFAGNLSPGTLTREQILHYDSSDDEVITDSTEYSLEGWVESYSEKLIADGVVSENERKIGIIANSLDVEPTNGDQDTKADRITIEGHTYTVTGTPERDPAGATWTVRVRI